ncbi:TolC family protein [Pseudobdellovibrio sp. HCB154]|uniref:TolC family protein n=1 Tax=Pseudobdellovibrio sp. HCB154 TaxID=3386277 RepID=UPI003917502F
MFTALNKSYVRNIALSMLCLISQPAMSDVSPLKLTEDDVIKLVQSQSLNYQEIENRNLTSEFTYQALNGSYRLNLNFDYSLEKDKTESVSTFAIPDSDKTKKTLILNKRFYTGTATTFEYTNVDYDSNTANYAQNYYTLGLEQNIYPYIFSNSEMQVLKAAKTEVERTRLQTDIDLLDNTKDVLALYWRVQASQKSVQENEDLLKKYGRLVANVKSKKANSYASAGEVEQALAEYETRKQTWLEDRNTLLTNLQQLKTALNIPTEQQIELTTPQNTVKPLPAKFQGDVKALRRYKVQQLKTESAVASFESTSMKDHPKVSVYGKYTGQGLDPSQSESFNEMKDDPKDKYIVGVKLDYFFGDDLNKAEKQLRRATQEVELARFARAEGDLKLQIENTRQKLENAYANVETTQNVVKYRTEAVKQLNVTYFQGRTDISFLIDAFNKKIQAEVAAINALGNYTTTLLEYENLVR